MMKLEHISPILTQCASRDGLMRNPFRIFGVRVDTTGKQIESTIKDLRMQIELGMQGSHAYAPTACDQSMMAQAGQRMRDSVARICDECFWFWPMDLGAEDVALEHIGNGDKASAASEWSAFLEHPEWGPIAHHNLAVLSLYESLEHPASISEFGEHAAAFLASEACANRIKARMRTLDDPRLPRNSAKDFMHDWRHAIVREQVRMAIALIEQSDPTAASRHIRCAQRAAGDNSVFTEIAEGEFEPRLRELEDNCQGSPEKATDAAWQSLAKDAQRLVSRMRSFPGLDARAAIAGNEACGFLMRIALHSHNSLKNSQRALQVLEAAKCLASGDILEKVRRDIKTINEIIDNAASEALFGAIVEKIKGAKASGTSVSSHSINNLLREINTAAESSSAATNREILSVLYHNLGFVLRGLAVDTYNSSNNEVNAVRLLDLAQEVVEASERRGMTQSELKYKILEDRAALARNRAASRPVSYAGSSGGNSCMLALVALLCLTGAVGYAAPIAAKAVTAWITHQLQ